VITAFAAGFDDTDQDCKNTGTCFRPCAMADFSQYDPVSQGAFRFVIGQWQMWKFQYPKDSLATNHQAEGKRNTSMAPCQQESLHIHAFLLQGKDIAERWPGLPAWRKCRLLQTENTSLEKCILPDRILNNPESSQMPFSKTCARYSRRRLLRRPGCVPVPSPGRAPDLPC